MKLITSQVLEQKLHYAERILVFSVFGVVGFAIPFVPFAVIKEINLDSFLSFLFLLLVFGFPFGYMIGLRKIVYTYRTKKCIQQLKITIIIDEITGFNVSHHGEKEEDNNSFCEVSLKRYSKSFKRNISIEYQVFRKLKKGDKCVLVFIPNYKKPVFKFFGNEYVLSEELVTKII